MSLTNFKTCLLNLKNVKIVSLKFAIRDNLKEVKIAGPILACRFRICAQVSKGFGEIAKRMLKTQTTIAIDAISNSELFSKICIFLFLYFMYLDRFLL